MVTDMKNGNKVIFPAKKVPGQPKTPSRKRTA